MGLGHSHASLLANEGINIQEIARRLGHSDIKMTWNTYSHLYPREEERAIIILDKIVYKNKTPRRCAGFLHLVEMTGIEPVSENLSQ